MIDIRTVLVSYAVSNAICAVVIALLWLGHRKRYSGLGFWLADFAMQFIALILVALRGSIPDFVSIIVSQALIVGGTILLLIGLERFVDKRTSQIHNYVFLAVFLVVHSYFSFIQPSLLARNINFSLGLIVICAQCAWLMIRRVDAEMLPITRGVGSVFLAFCLFFLLRIILDLVVNPGNELFNSGIFDTLSVLMDQMLFIILTFGLYLMVNRRLVVDLEHDIIKRKQTDAALRLSEEKFFKAFHSSPDAILISRIEDGRLIEVNEGFSRITGYSREEALSNSSISLKLWLDLQDREKVIAALKKHQRIRDQVYEFHIKSGGTIIGLYSGEIIFLGDEAHILSVVRDISEQKQAEDITRLRLELWECAATYPLENLMQKALDEIGALTGSPIGFYHFVEEDQKTLSLQAWSTRTLAEFCRAEGKGLHYDIDEAGVWVDAFHQRKPVIHNDYAALPHRKGLPEGHAEVVRQLVVPVLREGRVVSILGVGNKSSEYDESDVKLVSYIADIVWTIVERKRAEEQICQLNVQLERLAMTDELTGILNRRSFFSRGAEEINRFLRYQAPLTLLILDIDGFKKINDTYGHMAGDQVLKDCVSALQRNLRRTDILARLGGEEFGIILQNTGKKNASVAAEKLRRAVEKQFCVVNEGQTVNVTVSIGVATANDEVQSFETLLRNADAALYQAKDLGRNRVFLMVDK